MYSPLNRCAVSCSFIVAFPGHIHSVILVYIGNAFRLYAICFKAKLFVFRIIAAYSVTMNIFRKKYFLFKSLVKVE